MHTSTLATAAAAIAARATVSRGASGAPRLSITSMSPASAAPPTSIAMTHGQSASRPTPLVFGLILGLYVALVRRVPVPV
jgi:hypothetical protein